MRGLTSPQIPGSREKFTSQIFFLLLIRANFIACKLQLPTQVQGLYTRLNKMCGPNPSLLPFSYLLPKLFKICRCVSPDSRFEILRAYNQATVVITDRTNTSIFFNSSGEILVEHLTKCKKIQKVNVVIINRNDHSLSEFIIKSY